MTRDGAERLLACAVVLLPASRREWGAAMHAELAGIEDRRERLGFACGCARAVVSQPAVLRAARLPVLTVAAVVAILGWTSGVGYPPLRWGLVASVLVLLAVSWLGRYPGPFGPVHEGVPARVVRAGGYLLVAGVAFGAGAGMPSSGNPVDQAVYGVPAFTVVLTVYLLAFLAVTARPRAVRRVLITAGSAGVAAGALWIAAVVAAPPVPTSAGLAVALTAASAVLAFALTVDRPGRRIDALLAALGAACVAALLIVAAVFMLARYASPGLIPDLAPAALSPADDLAQSRSELIDSYLLVLLLGGVLAVALGTASIATRRLPIGQAPSVPEASAAADMAGPAA